MKEKTIFALGFFDGVHLGHQALLRACKEKATEYGCRAGVVTFTDHPEALVPGKPAVRINTPEDRERMLKKFGMDEVLFLPFDRKLMNTPWQDFLNDLMKKGAAGFVCGNDFRFGAGGKGTAEKLADFCSQRNIPCSVIPEQTMDGVRICSTYIRSLLESGEMEKAVAFLGHPHILTSEVISGRGLGQTMGIPTANLSLPQDVLMPKPGVYACKAWVGEDVYIAVCNIGSRPTVGGHHVTIEPHLLDFSGDLYGKTITLEFHKFLRPEQKFDSLDALKTQIQKDIGQCTPHAFSPGRRWPSASKAGCGETL